MKKSRHEKKTSCFDHDLCVLQELAELAKKMKFGCCSEEKSSKEIMRDFLIGIKKLKAGL